MSRPQPTIICETVNEGRHTQVCVADSVYAVLLGDQPIKLRTYQPDNMYQGYKYGKTTFPESGHAFALADRLNAAFGTDQFCVAVMTISKILPTKTTA